MLEFRINATGDNILDDNIVFLDGITTHEQGGGFGTDHIHKLAQLDATAMGLFSEIADELVIEQFLDALLEFHRALDGMYYDDPGLPNNPDIAHDIAAHVRSIYLS